MGMLVYSTCMGTFFKRHSFTTRFLTSCISSHLFAGNQTLQDLHTAFAEDARNAFYYGVEAAGQH